MSDRDRADAAETMLREEQAAVQVWKARAGAESNGRRRAARWAWAYRRWARSLAKIVRFLESRAEAAEAERDASRKALANLVAQLREIMGVGADRAITDQVRDLVEEGGHL